MKTHGIANMNTNSPAKNVSTPKTSPQKEYLGLASKKRKVDSFCDEDEDDCEEDYLANVKMEGAATVQTQHIKYEPMELDQTEMGKAKMCQAEIGQTEMGRAEMGQAEIEMFQPEPVKGKKFQPEPVKGKAGTRRKPGPFIYEKPMPFGDLPPGPGSDYTRGNFINAPYAYVLDKTFQLSADQAARVSKANEESSRGNEESSHGNSVTG